MNIALIDGVSSWNVTRRAIDFGLKQKERSNTMCYLGTD